MTDTGQIITIRDIIIIEDTRTIPTVETLAIGAATDTAIHVVHSEVRFSRIPHMIQPEIPAIQPEIPAITIHPEMETTPLSQLVVTPPDAPTPIRQTIHNDQMQN